MGAQEGKPWCRKAGRYILPEGWENTNLSPQCRECRFIIYVGCPGFDGSTKRDKVVEDYIRWMRGEPVAEGSPIFNTSKQVIESE